MDCIDTFLRIYGPDYDRPFGGIQMVFFGDLFQLPPVVARQEENIFKTHYPTPYFFSAKVFERFSLKTMQLNKIYRQKDEHFIRLLNAVRDDSVDHHHWEALNHRFKPQHQFSSEDFSIVLTTTNALAERVNNQRLQALPGVPKVYQGFASGEFERRSLPAPEALELKKGAQVMMLNNDTEKRWVNGSLGRVVSFTANEESDDTLMVELEDGTQVDVKKYTWEIYQYYFDEVNNALGSKIIGYFTQYPLKLAWAVTIHKSQGQTFERVVIDVGWGTFAHGQMYVALSRCTTLEGIVLKQPLNRRHILMDERILQFMKKFIFILFLPFLLSYAQAQTPTLDRTQAVAQDLSQIEDKQVDPAEWEEKNKDQPYIGLLTETDTVIHDDWSFDQDYHARVKIQKETAKNLGQWPIYYNKSREQITDVAAFIETPDGRKLQATDISDLPAYDQSPLYADMRLKVIRFPEISIGTVIDVRVKTKVSKEEMPGAFWDEVTYPSIPTKYTRNTYIFPSNKNIRYSAYNNDKQPLAETNGGNTKYSYVYENTSYSETDDFMPPSEEVVGTLSLSSVGSWKQVADWWRTQIDQNTVDSPDITAKVMGLIKDKTTAKDKLRAIVEFIQDNYRYVSMSLGDHAVDMLKTDAIFNAHYGDAKDLVLLTRQMLKVAGITADVALFSGEFNGDPQHQLPNPSAFESIGLQVNLDGQKYFVDPQTKGYDLGEYPSDYDNAYLMVITPDSYEFKNLPVADESFHAVTSVSDVYVNEDGSANFDVHVQMPIEASQDMRRGWDSSSDASKQKFFENLQATFAQGGRIADHEVKGLEKRYGPLDFDFKYGAANVYQTANDMVLLKEQDEGDVPHFGDAGRRYPVFVPTNSVIINRNIYHVPDSLKIDFVPPDFTLSTGFMQVSIKYTKVDDTVTVESAYHIKRTLIPVQGLPDIQRFRQELDKNAQLYIILRKKSKVSTETKNWIQKS
jgi:hypothetical protein